MEREHRKAGAAVKEGIIGSLTGISEIEAEIVGLVRNTASNSFRASGAVASEGINVTPDIIKGAIQAMEEIGTGLQRLTTSQPAKLFGCQHPV